MIRNVTVSEQGNTVNSIDIHIDLDKVSDALSEIQLSENILKENCEPRCVAQYTMAHKSVEKEVTGNNMSIADNKSDCFRENLSEIGLKQNNSAMKKTSSDEDKEGDCIDEDKDEDWIDVGEEEVWIGVGEEEACMDEDKKINSDESSSIDPRINAKINAAAKKLNKLLKFTKSFLCRRCGKSYHKKKHLNRHERFHQKGLGLVQKVLICHICKKMCAGLHEYKVHRLLGCVCDSITRVLSHSGIISKNQDHCKKGNYFSGKSSTVLNCLTSLESVQTCSGGGTHQCICGCSFSSKKDLLKHYRTRTHQDIYACTLCGKAGFSSKSDARSHILSEHGIKSRHHHHHKKTSSRVSTQEECKESTHKSQRKIISCKKCKIIFTNKKSLTKHRIKMHPRRKNISKSSQILKKDAYETL